MADTFTFVHRVPIISAAARNNVPAVYFRSEFVRGGGLLSYGPDPVDMRASTASATTGSSAANPAPATSRASASCSRRRSSPSMPSRPSTPRPKSQRHPNIRALAAAAPCASSRPSGAANSPATVRRQCPSRSGSIPHDADPAHQHAQRSRSSLLALRQQCRVRIDANIMRNPRSKTLRSAAHRARCSTKHRSRCFRPGKIEAAADAPRYMRA